MTTTPAVLDPEVRELLRMMARLVRRMRRLDESVPPELQPIVSPAGLGPRHLTPLIAIAMNGELSVGELAEHLALTSATTSQLVNELAKGGLVAREGDPRDRRRTLLTIHPDHRASIVKLVRGQLEPVHSALGALSEVERAHFMKGWRLLVDAMEGSP